jgi:hypothetical protein
MLHQIGDQIVINHYFWLKYGQFGKVCPFSRSNWSAEFNTQIAGNSICGFEFSKFFRTSLGGSRLQRSKNSD